MQSEVEILQERLRAKNQEIEWLFKQIDLIEAQVQRMAHPKVVLSEISLLKKAHRNKDYLK